MLQSFNKNEYYFNACVIFILNIVLQHPEFNNYDSVCELFDIYVRKIVMNNSAYSSGIKSDCLDLIEFFFSNDYISHIVSSFNNSDDAYHYLAILVQFQRFTNKYQLKSVSPYHYYNPTNIFQAVSRIVF